MTNKEYDKLVALKQFILNASAAVGFSGDIFIVNPLFEQTGNYTGRLQQSIDNSLNALNRDFLSEIQGEADAAQTQFNNLTLTPPIP